VFSGGMTGTSAGITAAIFFSYIMSLIFTSKTKK
ncbi:MAG: stage V sporulation protein AE, partial [Clostridium sp.]|nr:stage V sporulation protein AE [Clostridium sp.]